MSPLFFYQLFMPAKNDKPRRPYDLVPYLMEISEDLENYASGNDVESLHFGNHSIDNVLLTPRLGDLALFIGDDGASLSELCLSMLNPALGGDAEAAVIFSNMERPKELVHKYLFMESNIPKERLRPGLKITHEEIADFRRAVKRLVGHPLAIIHSYGHTVDDFITDLEELLERRPIDYLFINSIDLFRYAKNQSIQHTADYTVLASRLKQFAIDHDTFITMTLILPTEKITCRADLYEKRPDLAGLIPQLQHLATMKSIITPLQAPELGISEPMINFKLL